MDLFENFANGAKFETLAGARTLTKSDPIVTVFDPGGDHRAITLDDVGGSGRLRLIVNAADAAENLTIATPSITIAQNRAALIMGDSVTGAWSLVRYFVTAAS